MKGDCSLHHLALFWERFLYHEVKLIILKFLRDFCLIFRHQDHFKNNNKYGGNNSPSHKNNSYHFSYKTLKNSNRAWKKRSYQTFTTYLTYINLVSPILAIWSLISALNFIFTKNKILLLDPPLNENSDVSFVSFPHKTTENTTIFLVITKTLT